MTDRELLDLAAKAAGYTIESYTPDGGAWVYPQDAPKNEDGEPPIFKWSPRADDGDAFRLADQLQLNVDFCCYRVVRGTKIDVLEDVETGRKAIRRAIVRAAAEIGKGMK